jgi:hypothetical protein
MGIAVPFPIGNSKLSSLLAVGAVVSGGVLFLSIGDKKADSSRPSLSAYQPQRISEILVKDVVDSAEKGTINLHTELRGIAVICHDDPNAQECGVTVARERLKLDENNARRIGELFEEYRNFEEKLKYDIAHKRVTIADDESFAAYRRANLDDKTSELIYGLDDAVRRWQQVQSSVIAGTLLADTPQSQKLAELERYKKESLGRYYETIVAAEPPQVAYGNELMLLQNEIATLPKDLQQEQINTVRERHFTPAEIKAMDASKIESEQQESKAVEQVEEFVREEKKMLSENPQWSAETKAIEIEKLRARIITRN